MHGKGHHRPLSCSETTILCRHAWHSTCLSGPQLKTFLSSSSPHPCDNGSLYLPSLPQSSALQLWLYSWLSHSAQATGRCLCLRERLWNAKRGVCCLLELNAASVLNLCNWFFYCWGPKGPEQWDTVYHSVVSHLHHNLQNSSTIRRSGTKSSRLLYFWNSKSDIMNCWQETLVVCRGDSDHEGGGNQQAVAPAQTN